MNAHTPSLTMLSRFPFAANPSAIPPALEAHIGAKMAATEKKRQPNAGSLPRITGQVANIKKTYSANCAKVLEFLADRPSALRGTISDGTGITISVLKNCLPRMAAEGLLTFKRRGVAGALWSIADVSEKELSDAHDIC